MNFNVIESHGLTKLLHHVLGENFKSDDYLCNIPGYDALRKGDEKTRLELGPAAESFPSNVGPEFAPLSDSDRRALLKLSAGVEVHLDENDLGQLLNVSTLGTEPKKLQVQDEEKAQSKTKISLKTGVKKIKLQVAGKKEKMPSTR